MSYQKQSSNSGYRHQASGDGKNTAAAAKTDKEEWDKDIPDVSLFRVIALNAKEWWIIVIGVIGAGVNGSIFPLFSIIFGQILGVFALPPDEIQSGINIWAGLMIILGLVSGIAIFFKVRESQCLVGKSLIFFKCLYI